MSNNSISMYEDAVYAPMPSVVAAGFLNFGSVDQFGRLCHRVAARMFMDSNDEDSWGALDDDIRHEIVLRAAEDEADPHYGEAHALVESLMILAETW